MLAINSSILYECRKQLWTAVKVKAGKKLQDIGGSVSVDMLSMCRCQGQEE